MTLRKPKSGPRASRRWCKGAASAIEGQGVAVGAEVEGARKFPCASEGGCSVAVMEAQSLSPLDAFVKACSEQGLPVPQQVLDSIRDQF